MPPNTRMRRTMLDSQRVTAPLSLTRTGSGEPLLLLHGLGTSRRDFTAVIPALTDRFDVINVDLPGIGRSPHLAQRPTVAAITDAVEHTLDAAGLDRVHVLGNSLGARIALELAIRGRARSVVAIAPSGVNIPQERLYQGATMGLARIVMRAAQPLITALSRSAAGRAALLAPLKARPWSTSPEEAIGVREGFAEPCGCVPPCRLTVWAGQRVRRARCCGCRGRGCAGRRAA